MARKAATEYVGRDVWINQRTGEIREVDQFEKPVGRSNGFVIAYLAEIISLIENLGNKKMEVVKYILNHMDKSSNCLIETVTEISQKSGIGYSTTQETLKILENANLIKRKTGAVMLSPALCNNWRASKEATMMIKYYQFDEKNAEN